MHWRREKVSLLAAYGNERIPVFLFLPKNARPPYQTVVFFPNSQARIARSSADMDMRLLDYVIRSGRAIDWLETRPDIDRSRLAFLGVSLGAIDGITLVAVEDRFKSAVFEAGGYRLERAPPEVEPANFAPRIRIPVLLITGRLDFQHPYETAQLPFFRALGTPEKDKRHVVLESGHIPPQIQPVIREILDWLDRTLGPVPGAA